MTTAAIVTIWALAVQPASRVMALSVLHTPMSKHSSTSFHRRKCRLNMVDINNHATMPGNDTIVEIDAVPTTFKLQMNNGMILRGPSSSRSYGLPTTDTPELFFQSDEQISQPQSTSSWKDRLIDISNIASFLCVLDCTLLPLVSIALPAFSWLAGSMPIGSSNNALLAGFASISDFLPVIGHGIALFFVTPVGLLTTLVNYFFGHKQLRFSFAALLGIFLIFAANSDTGTGIATIDSFLTSSGIATHSHGGHVHDTCGAMLGAATGMLAHSCGAGWPHRLTNTVGCAFLLGSNHYGKKYMESQKKGCVANALAEAWGSNDAGDSAVCPPGCGCESPTYGASKVSTNSQNGGEMFFSWDRASGGDSRVRKVTRTGRSK